MVIKTEYTYVSSQLVQKATVLLVVGRRDAMMTMLTKCVFVPSPSISSYYSFMLNIWCANKSKK